MQTCNDENVICPHCGAENGNCPDWVKSMPHREACTGCGQLFLCWSEIQVVYYALPLDAQETQRRPTKLRPQPKRKAAKLSTRASRRGTSTRRPESSKQRRTRSR